MPRPFRSAYINHEDHQKTKTSEYFVSLTRLIALLWIFPDVNKASFNEILIVFLIEDKDGHRITRLTWMSPISDMTLFRSQPQVHRQQTREALTWPS